MAIPTPIVEPIPGEQQAALAPTRVRTSTSSANNPWFSTNSGVFPPDSGAPLIVLTPPLPKLPPAVQIPLLPLPPQPIYSLPLSNHTLSQNSDLAHYLDPTQAHFIVYHHSHLLTINQPNPISKLNFFLSTHKKQNSALWTYSIDWPCYDVVCCDFDGWMELVFTPHNGRS